MRASISLAFAVALAFAAGCSVPDFFLVDARHIGDGGDDGGVDARPDAAIDAPPGAAQVTNVTSSTTDGYYKSAGVISIQVTFDMAVTVDTTGGTPKLALNSGASASAAYASGSGTTTLTFTYTVATGESSADLDYPNTGSLTLQGGTIKNGTNNAFLQLASPGTTGSLGRNKALVIDAVVPTISTITGPGAYANSASAALTYTVTDLNPMTTTCAQTVGSGVMATCTTTGATFSSLSEGNHTISITHTDAAGNVSSAQTISWIVDTTAPVVSTITGVGAYSQTASATLAWSVTEANPGTTTCTQNTGTGTMGTCSATGVMFTALSEGAHMITVTHTDLATNTSTAKTISWTVDTINPVVSTPTGPAAFDPNNTATLAWTVTEANPGTTTCTFVSGTGAITTCTATGATISGLNEGAHVIQITHTDAAGRTGSTSFTWTVDTIDPVVSAITGLPNTTPSPWTPTANVTLSYTITEANPMTTSCIQDTGTGTLGTCNATTATFSNLSIGQHDITIKHTDKAGRSGATTISFGVCPVAQFTGATSAGYPYTTPSGCGSRMEVWLWGGGGAGSSAGSPGGGGGFVYGQATVVTSGQTFTVYVGGGAHGATGGIGDHGRGGNGGVNGSTGAHGGGGGGTSTISTGGNPIIMAGGGGGGGDCSTTANGGAGGGLSGQDGSPANQGGKASNQTGGGQQGGNGGFGVAYVGGDGGIPVSPGTCGGGAGGGGIQGGGGGGGGTASQAGGGGGAADFAPASQWSNQQHGTGSGQQAGGATDSHYMNGVGVGGNVFGSSVGGDGMVIIHVHP